MCMAVFPLKGPTGVAVPSRPVPRVENNTLKCGTLVKCQDKNEMMIKMREKTRKSLPITAEKDALKRGQNHIIVATM